MNKPTNKTKIAYIGPEGSYREAAARSFNGDAIYLACENTEDALNNLMSGSVKLALLPLNEDLRKMIGNGGKYKQLSIIEEINYKVVFESFEDPHTTKRNSIAIDPQTLEQCSGYIQNMRIEVVKVPNAKQAIKLAETTPSCKAIISTGTKLHKEVCNYPAAWRLDVSSVDVKKYVKFAVFGNS